MSMFIAAFLFHKNKDMKATKVSIIDEWIRRCGKYIYNGIEQYLAK